MVFFRLFVEYNLKQTAFEETCTNDRTMQRKIPNDTDFYFASDFDISVDAYDSIDISGYFQPSRNGTYSFQVSIIQLVSFFLALSYYFDFYMHKKKKDSLFSISVT